MIPSFLWRNGWLYFFILLATTAAAQKTKDVVHPRLLLPVRQEMKWGYADTAKNIVITPQFDAANNFSGGLAIVEKNRKAFAIDESGKILTPPFDQMIVLEDTLLQIYLNEISDTLGGWGICTRSAKVILPTAYDEISKIDANLFAFRKDSLWGVVNRDGRIYSAPAYTSIDLVYRDYLQLRKGKKIGLIDRSGTRLLDDIYARIYVPNKYIAAGYLDKTQSGNKKGWGAYDHHGNLIIPFGQDSVFRISSYFVGASEKDSIACYCSVAPGKNSSCSYKQVLAVDLYWAELIDFKKQCGLMDTLGNMIVPVKYSSVAIGGRGSWFVQDSAKKWGIYNAKGEMIVAPSYTAILPFRFNVTVVFDGKLQGLINERGEVLVPPADQEIVIRGNTVKLIRKNNTATFLKLDADGRIIDKSDYDEFRVIKITGTEAPVSINGPAGAVPGAASIYFPTIDSLDWYMDLKTSLWGLRNTYTNDTIISPRFNSVDVTRDGFTVVGIHKPSTGVIIDGQTSVTSDIYGLVNNKTGQIVIKPVYSTIRKEDLAQKNFVGFVRATMANGAEALITTDGSERTMSYTFIDNVHEGYARFCTGGKWTIEDPGEMITNITHFCTEQSINIGRTFGVASTSKQFMEKNLCIAGGKWGYLDSAGHVVIAANYDGAKQVAKETGIVKSEKKWGMIDMKGATRIPLVYDALYYMQADTNTFVIAQMNGIRYGYIDRNGNIKIPAELKLSKVLGNGFIGFSKTGKWGVMNSQGNVVCNEAYHEILPFSEGYAAVRLGNKWGYIDTLGTEVIAPAFEKAGQFGSGYARIVKDHRWGYIDKSGAIVIDPKYMQAGNFSGGAAPVRTRDGFGLMGKDGKWLQRPAFNKVAQLDSSLTGFFILYSDGSAGICSAKGKIIIPSHYEGYKYLGEGMIGCRNGNYWALADTTGRIISTLVFEGFKPFSEHFAAASQNGLWGFIRKNGKFAVEPKYRVVGKFVDHLAYAYLFPSSLVIDTLGNTKFSFKGAISYMGYSEGKFLIGKLNQKKEIEKQYFMTRHGVLVNRIEYKEAILFQDGAARVRTDGPTWGLVSFTGYYLVKPRYFALGPFEYGLARFQMRYTVGAFSLGGNQVLPVGYDAVYYDPALKKIRFEKGNAMGYLFGDGTVCWPETE